jgi:glutamate dehydrogenase (NAD(P)+)
MDVIVGNGAVPLLHTVQRGGEVLGYVAIDSTIGGRSCGGLRMLPDVEETEIRGLARAMTLKYGFLGLPQGGAKAGLRGDPEAPPEVRRRRLAAFAEAIAPQLHSRLYIPHADMGTDNADIRYLLETVGMPVKRHELRVADSGYYTAVTVCAAVKQAARHRGLDLSGCRVAIEGYGKVGLVLATLLTQAGACVVAVSTSQGAIHNRQGLDVARLNALTARTGSGVISAYTDAEKLKREALLELPVDILCPCARHDSVHAGNVRAVAARIVCAGANNPITADARQYLFEHGVLYVPDFVSNCGGVLGGTMEFASVNRPDIVTFLNERIGGRVASLLEEAAQRAASPYELAVAAARKRFERVRQLAENPSLQARLFQVGLEVHRRGWLPGGLVGRLALPYFERTVAA